MKKRIILVAILTVMLLQGIPGFAQSSGGAFEMKQTVVASGGRASSGGVFSLESTIGQPLAGNLSQNGSFSLVSGFQAGIPLVQTGSLVISGQVTNGGNALPGVIVALTGAASATTVTNAAGNYSFNGLVAGANYTVTPFFSNFAFNPPSSSFNNLSANQTANFAAAPCSFGLNPNGTNAPAAGANNSVTLTASTAGCTWTAVSSDNWISVTGASRGTGSGTVSYVVAANNGAQRTGTITIAGQNFIVTQSGVNGFTVTGIVSYGTTPANQTTKFVSGVNLTTTGTAQMSASTDNSGFYQLSGLTMGGNYTVTPAKTGNVNGISTFDATLVLRHVAANGQGPNALNANQILAADANGTGGVTAFDATLILRYVAANGQTPNTGQVGNWKFPSAPRSYGPVSGSQSNENYFAILVGEVNGNWTPPAGSLAETDESAQEAEKVVELSNASASDTFGGAAEKTDDETQAETLQQSKAAETEISIPADAAAAPSKIVLIPVQLANQSRKQIFGYSFAVRFDPNVLQPEANATETAGTLSNGLTIVCDTNSSGRIGISASSPSNAISASGTLLYLRFKVVGAPLQSSTVKFQTSAPNKVMFEDNAGSIVTTTPKNGKFTVSTASTADFVSVAGKVTTADGRGIRNVLVSLADERGETKTVLSGASGNYRFADVKLGATYTITVSAKKFSFNQSSQARLISGETDDVNFTADSQP
ncbi:MAG TPA: carboxypeptidase regulatory-like domain-containing protein [Pyrinomonadaceae bacterium]|jgi:hypothetical protein